MLDVFKDSNETRMSGGQEVNGLAKYCSYCCLLFKIIRVDSVYCRR